MSEPYWVALASAPVDYKGAYDPAVSYVQGDVVAYNGVNYIAVNPSLGSTPPIALPPAVGIGTSLPTGAVDGQEFILTDSLTTPSYTWRLRYNAAAAYWYFIGGSPWRVAVDADETTTTTASYVDLTTVGPQVTIPRAGDYLVQHGVDFYHSAASAQWGAGLAVGAVTPTGTAGRVIEGQTGPGASVAFNNSDKAFFIGMNAGDNLRERYISNTAGTAHWRRRWLELTPVRVA